MSKKLAGFCSLLERIVSIFSISLRLFVEFLSLLNFVSDSFQFPEVLPKKHLHSQLDNTTVEQAIKKVVQLNFSLFIIFILIELTFYFVQL